MTKYFAQDTPLAGLERMMMSVPGFQRRGSGMMTLSRFHYKPEDVDCQYCLHYHRFCQIAICPYIAERLESGAIGYRDLVLECFERILHAGLYRRIQDVERWNGPSQEILRKIVAYPSGHFASRPWDSMSSGYLAALYLLASKERLWKLVLSGRSLNSIDFSWIALQGFTVQDYPAFYSARRLYNGKTPMEAGELANRKLVSDRDFLNIIYAALIARYGKAVIGAVKEATECVMC